MTLLVRLYPRRWRERYEAEILDLLAERPASFVDRLDLVRGAFDCLAALRAGIGSTGRWRLVTIALALPLLITVPLAIGLLDAGPSPWAMQALATPYGLAWLLIGWLLVTRGAPTIIDQPPVPTQPHPADQETPA